MARVSDDEVLLLWRAVREFRSGRRPACAPRGKPPQSLCPLHAACSRWQGQPDDWQASLTEPLAVTEARRASWPCSRLTELLSPETNYIGRR